MKLQMELLVDAVRLLAAPASAQLQHLEALGIPNGVDELALEFDDIVGVAIGMRERRELSESQLATLQALNYQLDRMSGADNTSLWTTTALAERGEWADVRRHAAEALERLVTPPANAPAE